jgi:diacylglycerol kinase (ATP)
LSLQKKGGGGVMIGVLVNPQSGNGLGMKVWHQVQEMLIADGHQFVFHITSRPFEATMLTIDLLREHEIEFIIVIGGDGTIHEVANGLWPFQPDRYRCLMAVIPAGTGNDFAKAHGIPINVAHAYHLIFENQKIKSIDIIKYGPSLNAIALNSIGIGFDGQVARVIESSTYKKVFNRFGLGKLTYFIAMFSVYLNYRPCMVWLTINQQVIKLTETWMVVATNIPYFGGSMKICPDALADDGEIDVVVVQSPSRLRLLPILFKVYKGTHIHHQAVSMYRGKDISIRAEKQLMAQADGEYAGITPLNATIIAGAIEVIIGDVKNEPC